MTISDRVDAQVGALVGRPGKHGPDPEGAFTSATSGGGGEMPYAAEMKLSFGQDFSSVKAHTGLAGEMSQLGAAAATDGESVAFASDRPSRGVVAHELAHVAQKRRSGGAGVATKSLVSQPDHASEREADTAADRVAEGRPVSIDQPLTSSINLLGGDEEKATTGKHLPPEKEKDFRAFVIREHHRSYEAVIESLQTADELVALIEKFKASGGEAESWWGLGRRYAMNAVPDVGMGAVMGVGGALITGLFTGGLSLPVLGLASLVGGVSSATSSVTRDAVLDAGGSDRTASLASLAAGSFTGGAGSGLAKNGMKNILTAGVAEGIKQGTRQAFVQLGVGKICELTRARLSTMEATKPYANTINEALNAALTATTGGGSASVAGTRAAFGAVKGLILDGQIEVAPERQQAVLLALNLAEQAATSAIQSAEARRAGDESEFDREERVRKEGTSQPEEVVKPSIGDDDAMQPNHPNASPEALATPQTADAPLETSPTATPEEPSKAWKLKVGERELEVGGGKGVKYRGSRWSVAAGGGDGVLAERSVTNEGGDNDTRSFSAGGGKGAEYVASQTKASGESKILRVGAGGGDGLRVESSHGTETADVTHQRHGLGGGSAASRETEHIHSQGVDSSKTKLLAHGTNADGKGFSGSLGSSESHHEDMVGNSRSGKVELLPVSTRRDGNTVKGSVKLVGATETIKGADGSSQTVNADMLPLSGSVTREQTASGSTMGGTVDGSVAAIKVAQQTSDGSRSTKDVKLVPASGSAYANKKTYEDGTVERTAGGQGSVAVSKLESSTENQDGSHSNTKAVVGEHTARAEGEHIKSADGDVHASASGGTKFTAMRGHGESTDAGGSTTTTGAVFGQHEVSGQGVLSSTQAGTSTDVSGSVRDTIFTGATETVNADKSKTSKSVTLGEWERSGAGHTERDEAGTRAYVEGEKKHTYVTAAKSSSTKEGVTTAHSMTGGQSSLSGAASVEGTKDANIVRGSAKERDTKFKYATSRTGEDGSKTTLGVTVGDSVTGAQGKVVSSADGLSAKGDATIKSVDARADESHTTASGARVDSEQVSGESTRTFKGEGSVDPQLRPVFEGSHENKSVKYRVGGTASTAEKDLPGGTKGQVRVDTGVENATSEKTTVRIDGTGYQSHTSQGPSGERTWADAKAILKDRAGKILCVVKIDLKDEQTHEAARYGAATIQKWVEKLRGVPAPASGEPPREMILDEDEDVGENENENENENANPSHDEPEADAETSAVPRPRRPFPGLAGFPFMPMSPLLAHQIHPYAPIGFNPFLFRNRPPQTVTAAPPIETAAEQAPAEANDATMPALEPVDDVVASGASPDTGAGAVPVETAVEAAVEPAKPPPEPVKPSPPARGKIHTLAELLAESSTADDDRGGARNVMVETIHGSRSTTIGGAGGTGGKKPAVPDWRSTPGKRLGEGAKDRGDIMAAEKARLERMIKPSPKPASGTPPQGLPATSPMSPELVEAIRARQAQRALHPAPSGPAWTGGSGFADTMQDPHGVMDAVARHQARGSAPSVVPALPSAATWTGGSGVADTMQDPHGVMDAVARHQARGTAPSVVPALPSAATWTGGSGVADTMQDPHGVMDAVARHQEKGTAASVIPARATTQTWTGGSGTVGEMRDPHGLEDPTGPGPIAHVGQSCYLASILNLFAANQAYLDLLLPTVNPPGENERMRQLQTALGGAAQRVKAGARVSAVTVEAAIDLLRKLGFITVPDRTRRASSYQQDPAEVFSQILAALDTGGDLAVKRSEHTRRVDKKSGETTHRTAPVAAPTTSHVLNVAVTASDETLEQAIANSYGPVHRPEADDAVIERTDTVDSLPPTLTLVLDRVVYGTSIEVGTTVQLPASALGGAARGTSVTYRISSIVNHSGAPDGGHYVASVEHGNGEWRRNDDMNPKPSSAQQANPRADAKTARMITLTRI